MLKMFRSLIYNFDYISDSYKLEENLDSRRKNLFGSLMTILIFTVSVILGFMFGTEIYERKNPITASSKQNNKESKVYLKEMPLALSFVHSNGLNINGILDYFEIEIMQFEINISKEPIIDTSIKLINCSSIIYDKHNKFVQSLEKRSHKYFCMNYKNDSNFRNAYTEPNSQFINLFFTPCNPSKRICPKDLNQILSNFYVTITFIDSYFDSNNQTNPIQFYENTITQQISNKFNKRQYLRFNNNKYSSDNGWIWQNIVEYHYTSLQNIKIDINPINEASPTIFDITLESPKISETTKRNYLKIQELFAKVGGLVKGLHIVAGLFTKLYFSYCYRINLINLSVNRNVELKDGNQECKDSDMNIKVNNFVEENYIKKLDKCENEREFNNNQEEDFKNCSENIKDISEIEESFNHKVKINLRKQRLQTQSNDKRDFQNHNFKKPIFKKDESIIEVLDSFTFIEYLKAIICCNKRIGIKYSLLKK